MISPDEAFYGLGQHAAGLMNYRGASIHLQQKNPAESAIPVLISSRGYGLLWDNPAIGDVTIAQSSPTNLTWTSEAADAVDYYFMFGPELDDVIARLSPIDRRCADVWRNGHGDSGNAKTATSHQAELLNVANTYRSLNIPIDCVIQDWQYWSPNPWGSHMFDSTNYPNVTESDADAARDERHLIISVWARFDTNIANANALSAVNGLYTNVLANVYPAGYGQWYDPFNAAARQVYWSQISRRLFSTGIDGWWLDASEPELSGNWGEFRNYTTAAGPGARVFNAYPLMHTTERLSGPTRDEFQQARLHPHALGVCRTAAQRRRDVVG